MPDGQRILSGASTTVRVWLLDGTLKNTFSGCTPAVSASWRCPTTSTRSPARDDIKLFNVNDGAVLRTFTHHTRTVGSWRCCPTASASSAARGTTARISTTARAATLKNLKIV